LKYLEKLWIFVKRQEKCINFFTHTHTEGNSLQIIYNNLVVIKLFYMLLPFSGL
jgi:hypothetical protein